MFIDIKFTDDDIKIVKDEVYSIYALSEDNKFDFVITDIIINDDNEFIFTIKKLDNGVIIKPIIPLSKFALLAKVNKSILLENVTVRM